MKKRKTLLSAILLTSLVCLSGCSLFNDDDIAIKNSYNPQTSEPEEDPNAIKVGGVVGKEVETVPNALCFKSIPYGTNEKVLNSYKVGGVNHDDVKYTINGGEDYPSNKSNNNYDLYVPNSVSKTEKHTVILFVHGGAWVSGFKTDVNPYVHEFAKKGYVTATIKYSLLKRSMDDTSLSIFRNLDEIDACISSIKSSLEELDFDTTKTELVIGGASSGAHLSMLYSYSRGDKCPLPIKFIVDAVGPVDINPDGWKAFKNSNETVLNGGIDKTAIQTQKDAGNLGSLSIAGEKDGEGNPVYWNDYQTMRIANGMCGMPYTIEQIETTTDSKKEDILYPNEYSNSLLDPSDGAESILSVTYWMNKGINKYKTVCAYAGKDSIVGIAQYARLQSAFDANGIEYEYTYFKNSDHTEITAEKDVTAYNDFIENITDWLEA